jgi:hypothetical protein
MLISAIYFLYIEKNGQSYPKSLKKHDICVMYFGIFEKTANVLVMHSFFVDTVQIRHVIEI